MFSNINFKLIKSKTKSINYFRDLLIISGIIGIAISYSSLYIFHISLALTIVYLIYNILQGKLSLKELFSDYPKFSLFLIFFTLIWFVLLIIFSENFKYSFYHLIYIGIGGSIMLIIPAFINNFKDLKNTFVILGLIVVIDLFIGFGESLGLFRWFISRLSSLVQYFGYNNELNIILSQSFSQEYVKTMPTGFQYNPNDFAVIAGMTFPFFLLLRKKLISIIGTTMILWLCVAAGAKIVFLSCCFMAIISGFFSISFKQIFNSIFSILFIIFIITNGFGMLKGNYIKINETQAFFYKLVGLTPPSYNLQLKEAENSGSIRKELILFGVQKSFENNLWGYGGGQSRHQMEKVGGVTNDKICSLHNFWIELLMEGGIAYLTAFIAWYILILIKLFRIFRLKRNSIEGYFSSALLISFCGFIISSIAPSSVIYFIPMYIMFAISISLIKLCENESTYSI